MEQPTVVTIRRRSFYTSGLYDRFHYYVCTYVRTYVLMYNWRGSTSTANIANIT